MRRRSAPGRLGAAALWAVAAALVGFGRLGAAPERPAPNGRLADDLPPLPADPPDAYPSPAPVPAPPAPAPAALRPAAELPRPFAALRMAAEPLLTPRLALPRALRPDFGALRGLAARARPGEPVHVRLTAYCLRGTTRHGTRTRPGVVAADPRLFPLARHVELYAAGRHLGRFRVEDTGAGVRGPHIDIWTPDCDDARRFGSRAGVAALVHRGRE